MTEPDAPAGPEPVAVRLPAPEPQSRVTIFLRLLLLIPHAVFLYVYSVVAMLAVVFGWFAALFIGRLPTGIYNFARTWARTTAQVWSYAWLLTGRYPPFVARSDYPTDVELRPTRLNRLAVLFRIFLAIPAAIVASFAVYGLTVFGFFFWLAALVKGRLPDSAHQATTAVMRYFVRYAAYVWMLTPTYPSRLLGDGPAPEGVTAPVVDEVGEPVPAPHAADPTELRLSGGAKRLLVAMLVVGAVAYGGVTAAGALTGGGVDDTRDQLDLATAYESLSDDVASFQEKLGACEQAADPFACAQEETAALSRDVNAFYDRVAAIDFPAHAEDEAAALLAAVAAFRDATGQLAAASSPEEYGAIAESTDVGGLGQRLDEAYTATVEALD